MVEWRNAEQLGFENDSFDIVVATGILMFTREGRKVIDERFRVF